jgi:hydroxylamine dehydrogenase
MCRYKFYQVLFLTALTTFIPVSLSHGDQAGVSDDTQTCLECHSVLNPGIVGDWRKGSHSSVTPSSALKKDGLKRLVSSSRIPEDTKDYVVGCAECHMLNPESHKDTFEHNGYRIHTVVTPADCSVCHSDEARQYGDNLMSHAYGNLQGNSLYRSLVDSINGSMSVKDMKLSAKPSNADTDADSCLYCHGTEVKATGTRTIDTDYGEMDLPVLSGWPNAGVGRINPDGTMGACASCHTRHQFSIETARKPATCSECHKGPDVPAYGVYSVSKHGNIYSSSEGEWNFKNVPWIAGKDFTAPTCAACHVSLIASEDGKVISERTHSMNNRLALRIFGLVYAHSHPKSSDTSIIKNSAGLPLPTELTGEEARDFLISGAEKDKRVTEMKKVCLSCHSQAWVDGHFDRFNKTVKTSNDMTLTATNILTSAWEKGLAKGPDKNDSPFNEAIEKKWIEQWLFYANSTRFASAMGGADYGAFNNGRFYMSKNILEMLEWMELRQKTEK